MHSTISGDTSAAGRALANQASSSSSVSGLAPTLVIAAVNGHTDDVAAGNIPMLCGNFSYYGIRTVRRVEIFRFMDSRTLQNNAIECLAFSRRVPSQTETVAAGLGLLTTVFGFYARFIRPSAVSTIEWRKNMEGRVWEMEILMERHGEMDAELLAAVKSMRRDLGDIKTQIAVLEERSRVK